MSKYNRVIKGVEVDVYDILKAYEVTDPALQHLIKKALCAGLRGHKDRDQDLADIVESAKRAQDMHHDCHVKMDDIGDHLRLMAIGWMALN